MDDTPAGEPPTGEQVGRTFTAQNLQGLSLRQIRSDAVLPHSSGVQEAIPLPETGLAWGVSLPVAFNTHSRILCAIFTAGMFQHLPDRFCMNGMIAEIRQAIPFIWSGFFGAGNLPCTPY